MYDDAIIFWAYMNDARLVNTINVLLLIMYDDAFILLLYIVLYQNQDFIYGYTSAYIDFWLNI